MPHRFVCRVAPLKETVVSGTSSAGYSLPSTARLAPVVSSGSQNSVLVTCCSQSLEPKLPDRVSVS